MSEDHGTPDDPGDPSRRALVGAALAASIATAAAPASAQGRRGAPERAPMAGSAEEKRILAVAEDVYRNHRYLSVPEADGRLLRILAESIGARHVVELGTSTGYSGLWLLLARARTGGRLTTYEVDRGRHELARRNFERAGVAKQATLVLGDAHAEVAKLKDAIDLLFLDADKEGYLDYLQKLSPLVRPGGLIAAHNMASPPPDPRYVEAVTTNPAYDTVFLNMHEAGVGVTLKKR
ncbi:MAG: class I SAM-dependent methyltransferase [Betaproteobacteria bacterium]|nr:class I SAM-dependent methyltransferase [Betaproteobacteria bacterium]